MNQIPTPVTHPIAIDRKVVANKPSCPCKGATYSLVEGVVKKVIHNQTGFWYYLDIGVTVRGEWIQSVKQ
jgi:hypothetical protein